MTAGAGKRKTTDMAENPETLRAGRAVRGSKAREARKKTAGRNKAKEQ